ncbi:MAG: hypothetical protein ACOX6T_11195 [Myxococcales bacterium]|jgi:hypothetical protein
MRRILRIGLALILTLSIYGCGGQEVVTADAGTKLDAGGKDAGDSCTGETCGEACCPPGHHCHPSLQTCVPFCTPICEDRLCGDPDGCGGKCTGCPGGETCDQTTWQCKATCPTEMCNGACCPSGTRCDSVSQTCVVCTPNCTNRYCGAPDGCGGKCTACPSGETCDQTTWQCKPICSTEWCFGECCPAGAHCDQALQMCLSDTCAPNCVDRYCGEPDGCGGKCTACPSGQTCDETTWQCISGCPTEWCFGACCPADTHCDQALQMCVPDTCAPNCAGRYCGDPDGCGGKCTACPSGQTCDQTTWQCISGCPTEWCFGACCPAGTHCDQALQMCVSGCTPNCGYRYCGDPDGCGGRCTACPNGQICDATTWQCVPACAPNCQGKACGDSDGCGGTCFGACPADHFCAPTTHACVPVGSCDPSTCAQGQGCYDPVTGSSSGDTVCTCLPKTQSSPDTCAAYGLACGMDPDNPAAATCRLPEVWEHCDPYGTGCAAGHICVPLQGGDALCAAECSGPSSCEDPMTTCFQVTGIGNFCWFNFCAETAGNPDPSRYYQPCDSSGINDGTCLPFSDETGGSIGICFQGSGAAAGSLAACSPEATRSNPDELCPVGELCFGWYPDPNNPEVYKGTCLPVCNSSTNPNPVKDCAAGFACLDASQGDRSAEIGACMRDCDVFAPNSCPDNGLGQPEGCLPISYSTTEGMCWPHASPGSEVGESCSLDTSDIRENCVPSAICLGEPGAALGHCYPYCDPSGAAGPTCSGTCTPFEEGGSLGFCE